MKDIVIKIKGDAPIIELGEFGIQYNCRDGFCGDCRCKLISGTVRYEKEPLAWLESDEIVPCKAIPVGAIRIKLL